MIRHTSGDAESRFEISHIYVELHSKPRKTKLSVIALSQRFDIILLLFIDRVSILEYRAAYVYVERRGRLPPQRLHLLPSGRHEGRRRAPGAGTRAARQERRPAAERHPPVDARRPHGRLLARAAAVADVSAVVVGAAPVAALATAETAESKPASAVGVVHRPAADTEGLITRRRHASTRTTHLADNGAASTRRHLEHTAMFSFIVNIFEDTIKRFFLTSD